MPGVGFRAGEAEGQGDPDGAGEAGAAAVGTPQAGGEAPISGPSGQASQVAQGPRIRMVRIFHFVLTMQFRSPEEAEMARRSLAAQAVAGPVRKEFSVSRNVLTVRLVSQNLGRLQMCAFSCVQQLSQLVQILRRFLVPFLAKPHLGKDSRPT
ncbi:cancer/testis antigen 1-like [Tupaia chinensis]|uniref:cancer/testis antigen 1-like n=1 Tax=Tupaia chinensis TaxID=246437 RepID=UPI0003C8F823|nr:cancer/testis antigen 1-like [Tupaia chinensis]